MFPLFLVCLGWNVKQGSYAMHCCFSECVCVCVCVWVWIFWCPRTVMKLMFYFILFFEDCRYHMMINIIMIVIIIRIIIIGLITDWLLLNITVVMGITARSWSFFRKHKFVSSERNTWTIVLIALLLSFEKTMTGFRTMCWLSVVLIQRCCRQFWTWHKEDHIWIGALSVSYTHLTLPTTCGV